MDEAITLTLNDALYNAGIVGFVKICENARFNYEYAPEVNQLNFNSSILQNFTAQYLDTMMNTFQDDIIYTEVMNRISKIEAYKNDKEFENIFDNEFKYISDKMKRASYNAAYEIIQARNEPFDYSEAVSNIKSSKNYGEKLLILHELRAKMELHKDVFMMKDIAYTKIQPFWSGIAFLHKTKNLEEFAKAYDEKITESVRKFTAKTENQGNISCIQCGNHMSRGEASPMSWINDVGVDSAKKPSSFWNFNVDTYLCPVCTMIYSCIPLGFVMRSSEGVFINQNSSIKKLLGSNAAFNLKKDESKSDIFYLALDRFINEAQESVAKYEIDNIQVIRKTDTGYLFNTLGKDKLKILNKSNVELNYLVGKFYKKGQGYINVYREVLNRILNGANLYSIIYEALFEGIRNNTSIAFVQKLLIIQTVIYSKGGEKMESKYNYHVMMQGDNLRKRMMGDNQNENKIKSLSHRLINSLKTRNPHDFMDVMLRQYMSLGIPVPSVFMNTLADEVEFLNTGYSFLTGLNGGAIKEKRENEEVAK